MLFLLFAEARGAGAGLARRSIATPTRSTRLTASGRHGRTRAGCGRRCRRSRAWRTRAATPATSTSPPSTAGCSRRGMRRWSSSGACPTRWSATCCCRWRRESTPQGRRRISYHDLGVEQLGSVYERVLEYEPRERAARDRCSRDVDRAQSHRQLLHAAIDDRIPGAAHAARRWSRARPPTRSSSCASLDPAMGSGAFLVAACRYLADRCEQALIRDGPWLAGEVDAADRAALRRQVAERCLYGVDLNPTAVQLARLSLWLTTLAADRPLTFLDHHLAAGNSLIGARLAICRGRRVRRAGARRRRRCRCSTISSPETSRDASAAGSAAARARRRRTRSTPCKAKSGRWRRSRRADGPLARWSAAADLWCAARLVARTRPPSRRRLSPNGSPPLPDAPTTLPAAQLRASLDARARDRARATARFTGSWRFPKCSSTPTAGANPTAASTR